MNPATDTAYLLVAKRLAENSPCHSRKVGALIVQGEKIIAYGVNRSPVGSSLCNTLSKSCRRRDMNLPSGRGLEYCPAIHAEQAALLMAARLGVPTEGATMYAACIQVCKWCAGAIIEAGIKRLVFFNGPPYDELAGVLLGESGIEITTYDESEL